MRFTLRRLIAFTAACGMVAAVVGVFIPRAHSQNPQGTLPGHCYDSSDDDNSNYSDYLYHFGKWEDYQVLALEFELNSGIYDLWEDWEDNELYSIRSAEFASYLMQLGFSDEYSEWQSLWESSYYHQEESEYWWDTYEQYIGSNNSSY